MERGRNQSTSAIEAQDNALKLQVAEALRDTPVYKSSDIRTADSTVIPPGGTRKMRFVLDTLSLGMLGALPIDALDYLDVSVRSRWAQGGLSVGEEDGKALHGYTKPKGFAYSSQHAGQLAYIEVNNHATRPIEVPAGSNIFRYYALNQANKLKGHSLHAAVEAGKIQIAGQGWKISEDGNSILIPVGHDTFRAVRPSAFDAFSISDTAILYRDDIDSHLQQLSPFAMPQLTVGETEFISIAEGFEGELHSASISRTGDEIKSNYHLNSRLLDGNKTHHKVRVEIPRIVTPEASEEYVSLSIFQH